MIVTTVCGLKVKIIDKPPLIGEPYVLNVKGEDSWYLHEVWNPVLINATPDTELIKRKTFEIIW